VFACFYVFLQVGKLPAYLLPAGLPPYLFVCLPACLPVHIPANQPICSSVYLCLSVAISPDICPSVSQSCFTGQLYHSQLSFLFLFFAYFKLLMAPSEILTCGVKKLRSFALRGGINVLKPFLLPTSRTNKS
jgi:hypothetical protein